PSALLTGPLFSLLFRHVHRQMTESAILAAQIRQAIRDLLVLCLPGHPRICGPVEDHDPLLTLPADPRRDVFVDDAFDRAQGSVHGVKRERVLQPGAGRKHRRHRRRGLASFEGLQLEFARVHPVIAHGLRDHRIRRRRGVARWTRHDAILLTVLLWAPEEAQLPFMNDRTESATRSSWPSVSSANIGSESTSDATLSVTGMSPLRYPRNS